MKKYIPLDALVAEIKKRIKGLKDCHADTVAGYAGEISGLERLLSFLDNIEVKEVDLEKEIKDYIHALPHGKTGIPNGWRLSWDEDEVMKTAKHFFELGLSVNNPITAADRGTAEEIIINLKRVEKDYRIDLTKEIEWLRNKVKKGKEV